MGAEVAIEARDLEAAYGTRVIWSGVSFSVPAGSFTAVLGPNGAGKSTLIRMLLGQLAPATGELRVLGRPPRRGNAEIGYVPQGPLYDPELTIRGIDFVRLGVDGHRFGPSLSGASARARADEAIAAMGAEAFCRAPLGELSGGEQQRLLLAQALAGRPRLLLMDEPLSHLDVRHQGAMVRLIAQLAVSLHLTVVLIAHDVNPLAAHIDQVLYVAGQRMAIGPPDQIITSASLSAIYGAPIEVLRDSRGRVFVTGLEEETSHPH
ncbi:MAG TPA: ABC transporter ATP-binding protein [Candidatus Acidoferrales bacterium]|nr:ABC transporter ATP-binding protein [Candidatus Acidoferrales bacterium]